MYGKGIELGEFLEACRTQVIESGETGDLHPVRANHRQAIACLRIVFLPTDFPNDEHHDTAFEPVNQFDIPEVVKV